MTASINQATLLGRVHANGIEVRYSQNGSPCASFLLTVGEQGKDGKVYESHYPVEVWGKNAEPLSEVTGGTLVYVEGKLRRRKNANDQWDTIISAFNAAPIVA